MITRIIATLSLALAASSAHASFQSAMPKRHCDLRVEDLSVNGDTLTYERARKFDSTKTMVASNGIVQISPVKLPNGREAAITIDPSGCARVAAVLGVR